MDQSSLFTLVAILMTVVALYCLILQDLTKGHFPRRKSEGNYLVRVLAVSGDADSVRTIDVYRCYVSSRRKGRYLATYHRILLCMRYPRAKCQFKAAITENFHHTSCEVFWNPGLVKRALTRGNHRMWSPVTLMSATREGYGAPFR
jgi:hypothetical protein